MSRKATTKQETRSALLQTGMEMMMERGYTNTGIQEVLTALGVPKGSFYHYFDSKEAYAIEIIQYFDANYQQALVDVLRNPNRRPIDRLRDYTDVNKASLVAQGCRKGCLIGNLSQEMADQSEALRAELKTVMARWLDTIAACIEEGQAAGEIKKNRTPLELAELFSSAWNGAVMRAKTVKTTEPLDVVADVLFNEVLKV
jgi:TetR/AcrR family transcriptional repressor of nem operon